MSELINLVWDAIQKSLDRLNSDQATMRVRYERSEQAGGVQSKTLAQAQADALTNGVGKGDLLYLEDACNPGVDTGIGAVCWFDSGINVWRRVYDNAIATSCGGSFLMDGIGAPLLDASGILLTE